MKDNKMLIIQFIIICIIAIFYPIIALIIALWMMLSYAENRTEYKIWKTTGNIYEETIFKRWKKVMVKSFSEEGILESETPYKNGWKNGLEKVYYPNGKIRAETPYKNSVIDGVYKEYYADGTVETIHEYDSGKLVNTIQDND